MFKMQSPCAGSQDEQYEDCCEVLGKMVGHCKKDTHNKELAYF